MSELMTTKEASEYLKIGYLTLYKLAQQGEIPAHKVGGHWRFSRIALDDWFANKSKAIHRNILVLGDDIDTAALSNILTSINHNKVTTVSNLEQVLAELKKQTYSVIFISSATMNIDCSKTISEIRAGNYKTTIIAGIGPNDKPISLDPTVSGPIFVIKKPFEEADVLEMLRNVQETPETDEPLIAALVAMRQRIDDFSIAENERKTLEDSLRLSEEKLRNFMESSNDVFILTDKKLNIVEMNTSAIRYLPAGMDRTNAIGKNILDISPSIKDILRERYLELLRTNKPAEIDDIVIDTQIGTHMRAKAFKTGTGFGIIATDITDSKLLEVIKKSEEFRSTLLDNAPHPILVYAQTTRIIYANIAFETLTGFSLKDIEGLQIPYPWWQEDTLDHIAATLKDPAFPGTKKLELQFTKKNGDAFWAEINTKAIMKDDQVSYYIANWIDITERKALELSLRKAEEKFRKRHGTSLQE